jgi:hypothetical protein
MPLNKDKNVEHFGPGDWIARESLEKAGVDVGELTRERYFGGCVPCGHYSMLHVVKDFQVRGLGGR